MVDKKYQTFQVLIATSWSQKAWNQKKGKRGGDEENMEREEAKHANEEVARGCGWGDIFGRTRKMGRKFN